jgi:hypothetical protein
VPASVEAVQLTVAWLALDPWITERLLGANTGVVVVTQFDGSDVAPLITASTSYATVAPAVTFVSIYGPPAGAAVLIAAKVCPVAPHAPLARSTVTVPGSAEVLDADGVHDRVVECVVAPVVAPMAGAIGEGGAGAANAPAVSASSVAIPNANFFIKASSAFLKIGGLL